MTYLNGEVIDLVEGRSVAVVQVAMTNQRGETMAQGTAEVRLPDP
jgi:acyl-coenzyme A thioesterase PaaI-like protein